MKNSDEKRAARTNAARKYHEREYKRMTLTIRNNDMDMLDRAAACAGQSRTTYILQAVRERIKKDDAPAVDALYNNDRT